MSVRIRLSRIGKKHRPFYKIVAIDSRAKRDGRYLDNIGTFDPMNNSVVQFHQDKLQKWVSVGAQCSDSVKKIVLSYNRQNVTNSKQS